MEEFSAALSSKIKNIELSMLREDELIKEIGNNFDKYIEKAKEALKKKHVINPKPQKRVMRVISENEESMEENLPLRAVVETAEVVQQKSPQRESLRPVRTAKANASKNLKEPGLGVKIRNDNNVAIIVKTERVSVHKSRDSTKENTRPNNQEPRISVDEGVQTGSETDLSSEKFKRSMSVEHVPVKPVEIDITTDEKDAEKMPPPPIPIKKKKAQQQSSQEMPADPTQPIPMRVTRSKIKKEKPSIGRTASAKELTTSKSTDDESQPDVQKTASESVLMKADESTVSKKAAAKKKYPLPILVKIERRSSEDAAVKITSDAPKVEEKQEAQQSPPKESTEKTSFPINETVTITSNLPVNETVTIASNLPINETVTIASNLPANQTVTLSNNVNETYNKNMHDSLMTEDNDEDTSMEVPLAALKESNQIKPCPQALPLKLKKNEVFNPYLSSPVKQKVQAFEKHAVATPDKSKAAASKYSTLKSGTPSKIASYAGGKTTPLNNAKQKYIAAISGSASSSTSTTSSMSSNKKLSKKYTSIDSNEDLRKVQTNSASQQLEEKRRQREEKQRQVQLQREAIEKQKREQTLQQQREREEKFRKIMQEKEEAKRMEAIKKKMLKENQEKKYAEEKARHEPPSASKDESLLLKMQRQVIAEKTLSQKKKVDKNAYSFDMLNTDDSTDDESRPSKKRPEPPQWSRKQVRQKQIYIQSFANSHILDTLFSARPINVNLKEIFPAIDSRKLVRNSSAVWNTPPRYSQMPKY